MSDVEQRAAVVERVYQDVIVEGELVDYWTEASLAPTCSHVACWNAFAGDDLP